MKFIVDTNFMIYIARYKIDIFNELLKFGKPEIFITENVLVELKKMSKNKGKKGLYANTALKIVKELGFKIIKSEFSDTDNDLVYNATKEDMKICTMDKKVMEKARDKGLDMIIIRQRKYLEFA